MSDDAQAYYDQVLAQHEVREAHHSGDLREMYSLEEGRAAGVTSIHVAKGQLEVKGLVLPKGLKKIRDPNYDVRSEGGGDLA